MSFPTGPVFSAANFLQACLNELPRGRVWAKYLTSKMVLALQTLMPAYERNTQAASALLVDAFPASTLQLIPEWQLSLGLPDPCSGQLTNTDQQRAQILARFLATGVSTKQGIIDYAAALGFVITITENFGGFIMGHSYMGGPDLVGGDGAIFIWTVHAPLVNYTLFYMGTNVMGDYLGAFTPNDVLECEIRRIAPANTYVQFSYS